MLQSTHSLLPVTTNAITDYGTVSLNHSVDEEQHELQSLDSAENPPLEAFVRTDSIPEQSNATPLDESNLANSSPPNASVDPGNSATPDSQDSTATSTLAPASRALPQEWRSWKVQTPWLSFLLFIAVALVITIGTLDQVSRHNSGFVRLGEPPSFITNIPGLGEPIWAQGILYTAFPAFIVTLYRTMWETSIMAFADRQPYVELKKPNGGPPSCTVDLDYRSTTPLCGWWRAFKNRHFLLGVCFVWCGWLTFFVVPMTSFLFVSMDFNLNSTSPISNTAAFSNEIWLNLTEDGPFSARIPDIRLSLNAAAGSIMQNGTQPRWTYKQYAFGQFASLQPLGEGMIAMETSAYSIIGGCKQVPEEDIQKQKLDAGNFISLAVVAQDRGCQIMNNINFRTGGDVSIEQTYVRHWVTRNCEDPASTRLSILAAVYNRNSNTMSNFSLISCAASYRTTPGSIHAEVRNDSSLVPSAFVPSAVSNSTDFSFGPGRLFFENGLSNPSCLNQFQTIDSSGEFGNFMYQLASRKSPLSPLAPNVIIEATEDLFSTSFAIFASSILFPPAETQQSVIGVYSRAESRIVVAPFVAYIIISFLVVSAILTIMLFVSSRHVSMLVEEPVGLLGFATLLYQSGLHNIVQESRNDMNWDWKTRESARRLKYLADTERYGVDAENRIQKITLP